MYTQQRKTSAIAILKSRVVIFACCLFEAALMLSSGCSNRSQIASKQGQAADPRIVARTDFDASPEWDLPVFMGRDFWNMLQQKQERWFKDQRLREHINTEPMVAESAVRYDSGYLNETSNPLEVGVGRLDTLNAVTNVPIMVCCRAGRPPFRLMMPFRPDLSAYQRWKNEHPNFIGFEAGTEWDNEFVGPLRKTGVEADPLRKNLKNNCFSENDIEACIQSAIRVVQESKKGRREAVAGLKECYEALRRYYFNDDDKMIFMRGGWCFDHYPLAWGAGGVTLETSNTGRYRHQVSMFFIRGAARQYRKFWTWYIATFLGGYDSRGQYHNESCPYYTMATNVLAPPNDYLGKDYGMSTSLNRRDMYLGYLSGASFVQHETWPYAYCQLQGGTNSSVWELSPHGEVMKEWYGFTRRHPERGISYTPVALTVPFSQGYAQWGGKPFTTFPVMRWDAMIDAFMYTLAPLNQDTKKGQEGCLANGPYGDIYDVLVLDPPGGPVRLKTLNNYKVVILLGQYELNRKTVKCLEDYVSKGGTLVVNIEQINDLFGEKFTGLARSSRKAEAGKIAGNRLNGAEIKINEPYDYAVAEMRGGGILWEDEAGGTLAAINRYGKGNVITTMIDWMVPREDLDKGGGEWGLERLLRGDEMPFVKLLMDEIISEVLPVEVNGDIEYGINKRKDGWLVYLINNNGVTKWTDKKEILDEQAAVKVEVECRRTGRVEKIMELRNDSAIAYDRERQSFTVEVGPGDIKIVLITTAGK